MITFVPNTRLARVREPDQPHTPATWIPTIANDAITMAQNLYKKAAIYLCGAVCGAVVADPTLAMIGFGTTGVAAGSIAAGVQSGIGNVAAQSPFASLQSAGAGTAPLATKVVGAAGGIAVTFAARHLRRRRR